MSVPVASNSGSERLHGLDAVRGYALRLGIVCFMTAPGYYLMRQPRPASFANKTLGA